jgi:hypothetical protein
MTIHLTSRRPHESTSALTPQRADSGFNSLSSISPASALGALVGSMAWLLAAARRLPIAYMSIARRSGGNNGDQA